MHSSLVNLLAMQTPSSHCFSGDKDPQYNPNKVCSIIFGDFSPISSHNSSQFMVSDIGITSFLHISPQSKPNSVIIVQIPVSLSPFIIALCIGFAPLYRGSNEA